MKLTPEEIAWVSDTLNLYDIKYQEIYDELKDHMLTAIERLRAGGDDRAVNLLWTDVLKQQFPGWWPFEDIVKQYQGAYQKKIKRAMWANFKHALNIETLPLLMILLVLAYYLPQSKPVTIVFAITFLMVSIIPVLYIWFKGRAIKTEKPKRSMVKDRVGNVSTYLMVIFNLLFNLVGMLSREWKAASFLNPAKYPPVVFVVILFFAFIYALSCIKLSRDEFKIA
ncbi:hypothetical protein [Mucilaginibacter myungsuensis]|uniref:Uncharacterized protein n=1 Tax=Mucilaginibacter myungsuensis TaxID=649104 RepID=A0A929PXG4_9SPHI|nr:hypothetical protein [Mucilaginibacter myungsuensis]MBE9662375.1 hypothetical protein [Mucilaginibacter myungsuensis]MDN3599188.1 hypothetical protein [Mucilaginibacter myungsuensis]